MPVSGSRPPTAGQLEGGVLAQSVKVIRIRVAAGDGEHPRTQDVGHRMGEHGRAAMVGDERGKGVDQAKALVGASSSRTPPSELVWPASKAAVTFFLQRLGNENGKRVSSALVRTADSVRA